MTNQFLLKGFEVELFTGTSTGQHVGVASDVADSFDEFVKEPDQRNLEYITLPYFQYGELKTALLEPRIKLRNWLKLKGLTILPASTLSLGNSNKFERSDYFNPYHEYIEKEYGTKVVTTSIHINLGIEDLSLIFAALRLVRCEASLLLSLSASSPFLDGEVTGAHSQRWIQFPRTPELVPIFLDHSHYVEWIEDKLKKGIMRNERHLWTSVRPNGPERPYSLNRLELRICDLISDCDLLLAVTALLELRVISLFNNPTHLDPLYASKLNVNELANLSDMNEMSAAKSSLNANLHHWVDGETISCRDWIKNLIEEVKPLAIEMDMLHLLSPLDAVLDSGNQSMRWLNSYSEDMPLKDILHKSILEMEHEELVWRKEKVTLG